RRCPSRHGGLPGAGRAGASKKVGYTARYELNTAVTHADVYSAEVARPPVARRTASYLLVKPIEVDMIIVMKADHCTEIKKRAGSGIRETRRDSPQTSPNFRGSTRCSTRSKPLSEEYGMGSAVRNRVRDFGRPHEDPRNSWSTGRADISSFLI